MKTNNRKDINMLALRDKLLKHQKELRVLIATHHTPALGSEPKEPDSDIIQTHEMDKEIEHRYLNELQRIDAALHRMDDQEYGNCVLCGEEISAERLKLDPAFALCTGCASSQDKQ